MKLRQEGGQTRFPNGQTGRFQAPNTGKRCVSPFLPLVFVIAALAALMSGLGARTVAAQTREEPTLDRQTLERMAHQIRQDKFDLVLPRAMRDNGIDMWIHVIRDRNPDPLESALGGVGVFVFSDRGEPRIERAILGFADEGLWEDESYDLMLGEEGIEGDPGWQQVVRDFVAERDPRRIAVNFSVDNPLADGISHTDFLKLERALGDELAGRIVSADSVINDFLAGIVLGEVVLDGYFGLLTIERLDREFAKIVPGVTTLAELDGNVFVRDPDGKENNGNDYVVQPGDMITILNGAGEDFFVADLGGNAYILRDDEKEPPAYVDAVWEDAMKVREILRATIGVGPTAGETLDRLISELEKAGFLYIDRDQYDPSLDPRKTQVHLDLHAQGRRDMDAPRISPLGPDWGRDMAIPLFHSFTLEYMVHRPRPELGPGKHVYVAFHDGAIVTPRGVEFPYPPDPGIRLIK